MLTGTRILIVEDEPLVALDLEATFKSAGALATCARSIAHAIDLINRGEVDLCVLDTQLWQGESSSVISDLLRSRRVPFAVFSAYQAPQDGAIAHITKPFTADEVLRVAKAYLDMPRPEMETPAGPFGADRGP